MDTTTVQASAMVSAIMSACLRSPPSPCCTIATGQPPAGRPGHADAPTRGMVTRIGTVTSATLRGTGLNMVSQFGSPAGVTSGAGGAAAAVQNLAITDGASLALAGGVRK